MTTENQALPPATFGELLRRWRRRQDLKQSDMGRLLVPRTRASTVSHWENDVRRPSSKYLHQIVALTGIPAFLVLGLLPKKGIPESRT